MRFLFTTLAGLGHFHPLVPAARALEAEGHVVAFATAPSFHRTVEGSGFRVVPAGFESGTRQGR
jgi:UDP:flavonoid glycosyltransferase YjiC (YdhE family)